MKAIRNFIQYIKDSRAELQKVKWPTKEQTIKYTKMVIYMSLAVAIFLGTLDYLFGLLITKIL
ncbi:MAG: preprotein translocase subunit SecE [Candidatus Moranbacteria bacterium]|nr:preprotein translocase subunit SecE [Candidatus Moranbacteria bacterium]